MRCGTGTLILCFGQFDLEFNFDMITEGPFVSALSHMLPIHLTHCNSVDASMSEIGSEVREVPFVESTLEIQISGRNALDAWPGYSGRKVDS